MTIRRLEGSQIRVLSLYIVVTAMELMGTKDLFDICGVERL